MTYLFFIYDNHTRIRGTNARLSKFISQVTFQEKCIIKKSEEILYRTEINTDHKFHVSLLAILDRKIMFYVYVKVEKVIYKNINSNK